MIFNNPVSCNIRNVTFATDDEAQMRRARKASRLDPIVALRYE